KRWPHRRRSFVPGFHVPVVRMRTGQSRLPVLLVDGATLIGSSRILEAIEHRRPEPPLFPTDPGARERALAIARVFDEELGPDVRRPFWNAYLDPPADCARMATDGRSAATRAAWRICFPAIRALFADDLEARAKLRRKGLAAAFDRLESEIGGNGYLIGG